MRAAAGLHPHDALDGQRAGARQNQRVLLGVDVVGDGADFVAVAEGFAQRLHQRGLARADGAADADAQGAVGGFAHGLRLGGLLKSAGSIAAWLTLNAILFHVKQLRIDVQY